MDMPGSAYLYTVATVSVTFVGFSALAMLFRQTVGTGITSYDIFFTITFMQTGFMVTAGRYCRHCLRSMNCRRISCGDGPARSPLFRSSYLCSHSLAGVGRPPLEAPQFLFGCFSCCS
jgi:hypothetical protein